VIVFQARQLQLRSAGDFDASFNFWLKHRLLEFCVFELDFTILVPSTSQLVTPAGHVSEPWLTMTSFGRRGISSREMLSNSPESIMPKAETPGHYLRQLLAAPSPFVASWVARVPDALVLVRLTGANLTPSSNLACG